MNAAVEAYLIDLPAPGDLTAPSDLTCQDPTACREREPSAGPGQDAPEADSSDDVRAVPPGAAT